MNWILGGEFGGMMHYSHRIKLARIEAKLSGELADLRRTHGPMRGVIHDEHDWGCRLGVGVRFKEKRFAWSFQRNTGIHVLKVAKRWVWQDSIEKWQRDVFREMVRSFQFRRFVGK